jgi:hypothetical protein
VQTDVNWLPGSRVLAYRATISGANQLFAVPVGADGSPGDGGSREWREWERGGVLSVGASAVERLCTKTVLAESCRVSASTIEALSEWARVGTK